MDELLLQISIQITLLYWASAMEKTETRNGSNKVK